MRLRTKWKCGYEGNGNAVIPWHPRILANPATNEMANPATNELANAATNEMEMRRFLGTPEFWRIRLNELANAATKELANAATNEMECGYETNAAKL